MKNPAKYAFIDSLRGLAFLGVMVHHTIPLVRGLPEPLMRIAEQGGYGVQLFFLASAMTLFMSLHSRARSERFPRLFFFIRRGFRIVPLFYAGALFYSLIDPSHLSLGAIISTLTFTHVWSPYWVNQVVPGGWSIGVEMTFYLMVPAFFRIIRNVRDAYLWFIWTFLFGIFASLFMKQLLVKIGIPSNLSQLFTWYWFFAQLPIFCLGFAAYFIVRPVIKGEVEPDRKLAWSLLAASLYLMAACTFMEVRFYFGYFGFGIAFLLLVWSLAIYPNPLLVNPLTRIVGLVSFSAYITHFFALRGSQVVLEWVDARIGSPLPPLAQVAIMLGLTLGVTMALSAVTYSLIEVPGQNLGKALIGRIEAAGEVQAVQADPALKAEA